MTGGYDMNFFYTIWSGYLVHVLDIMVVAYIFYRLMLVVKGTRAVQVIAGILTLVVITLLARDVFHLSTLDWLLEKFWLGAIVIIAVVFQPEIRDALAQLGRHRWSRILIEQEPAFIEEIIGAVEECSRRQIGALIVLEQETGLKTYVETGVRMNAEISKELILSVFNPRSPLHDGAIIITNGRLVAAACVLPLSNNPTLSKTFGTRHRSAIGIGELSDAVVIVVSEETGQIALVREGKFNANITLDAARDILHELFHGMSNEKTLAQWIGTRPGGTP